MYIGNLMLLVLNLPLVGVWVRLLKVPFNILGPLVVLLTVIGVYSTTNDVFQVFVLIGFGVLGYFMRKFRFDPGPLPLAFVLAPTIENSLRQSLIMSRGSAAIFFTRPISVTLLGIFAALVIGQLAKGLRSHRRTAQA